MQRLYFQVQTQKRTLNTDSLPDLTSQSFRELWELCRSLAATTIEQAMATTDPKTKRQWLSLSLRALRLASRMLEQTEYEDIRAKLEEIEARQKQIEEKQGEQVPPYTHIAS
jgi:hypothetical protein